MTKTAYRPHANERELLRIYPRTLRWMGSGMILLGICIFFIVLSTFNTEKFSYIKSLQALIAIIAGIWLSRTHILLSTNRIEYGVPFFKSEIQRQWVQNIKIIPDQRTQQLLNQPKWIKKISAKALNKDDEHWRKHGALWFQHSQRQYSLTKMSLRTLPLHILSDEQRHDLFQHLQTHWGFAVNEVEHIAISPVSADFNEKDIGQRCLHVLVIGILLLITMSFAPAFLYEGIHFGVESYMALIPCILFAIYFSYFYIAAEKKAYPIITAILSGGLLGGALYFSALQLNRWYSEQHYHEHVVTLYLESYDEDVQVWKLPPQLADTLQLKYVYLSPKVKGFDVSLKAQNHYTLNIKQGLFRDYFLDPNSLQHIQLIETQK